MKRLFSARTLAAAAVAIGAMGVTSAAHARSEVFLSIGVHAPYAYVQPAPVYVHPAPVYVQPQSHFIPHAPAYYGQQRYVERRGPYGDHDFDGVANVHDRDWRQLRHQRRFGPWGDIDRDGVPNRYDRAPHDPYRY